jgi:NADPH-dependent 2,4-dienoyl-CoA reductase/sulfur reductase-like enzyme
VILDETALLVATPELFHKRFNIEVRTQNEVTSIDRSTREIEVRDLVSGRIYREKYDALVLSPGAAAIRPPLPGIDLPGIFTLRTVPDSRRIREWIDARSARRAVVVGGGFIGLEMAENLVHRGIEVTIVEMANQLMPPLDPEMAEFVHQRLKTRAERLQLGESVAAFEPGGGGGLTVRTQKGALFPADIVILAIGVRPEAALARQAGLEIGSRGGIHVDDQMRTSDPNIWAVGDAVEIRNVITGVPELIPLAGPANRQGRIAAEVISGRDSRFRGMQGTAVCGFFGIVVAMTGATEKSLKAIGSQPRVVERQRLPLTGVIIAAVGNQRRKIGGQDSFPGPVPRIQRDIELGDVAGLGEVVAGRDVEVDVAKAAFVNRVHGDDFFVVEFSRASSRIDKNFESAV